MEYTADEKSKRSRTLICGSSLLLTATVAGIIVLAVTKPEKSDGTDPTVDPADPDQPVDPVYPDYEHHPMIDVYSAMPDFSAIGTNGNTDEEMKTDFWDDRWFGHALYDPFYKWDENDESHAVTNGLMSDLNTDFENIGEPGTYGRFNLKNI